MARDSRLLLIKCCEDRDIRYRAGVFMARDSELLLVKCCNH